MPDVSPLAADAPPARQPSQRSIVIAATIGAVIGKWLAAALVLYVAGVLLIGLDLSLREFLGGVALLVYVSS